MANTVALIEAVGHLRLRADEARRSWVPGTPERYPGTQVAVNLLMLERALKALEKTAATQPLPVLEGTQ